MFALLIAEPASACSCLDVDSVADLLTFHGDERAIGFYELAIIAGSPDVGLRGSRTASVVARFWGAQPEMGVRRHGVANLMNRDGCGNGAGIVGEPWFGVNELGHPERPRQLVCGSVHAPLKPADVAALETWFGPSTEVEITGGDRLIAHVMVWSDVAVGAGLAALGSWLVLRRSRPSSSD